MTPRGKERLSASYSSEFLKKSQAKKKAKFFVQGTIAPDWIESGGGLRDTIKSHHNVGGLPEKIEFEIVEPLRDLYKDEVRAVGEKLGLPKEVYEKQPFPGPGLAVRILGEASPENTRIVREACAIVEEEIETAAANKEMSQAMAVLCRVVALQNSRGAW